MSGFFANLSIGRGEQGGASLLANGNALVTPGGTISADGFAALLGIGQPMPSGIPAQAPQNLPTTGQVVRSNPLDQVSAFVKNHPAYAAGIAGGVLFLAWRLFR